LSVSAYRVVVDVVDYYRRLRSPVALSKLVDVPGLRAYT
jgi:hypothetical protein